MKRSRLSDLDSLLKKSKATFSRRFSENVVSLNLRKNYLPMVVFSGRPLSLAQQPFFQRAVEYARRKRKTKRDEFLFIMNDIIPWDEWVAYITPCYLPQGKAWSSPDGH